MDSIIRGTNAMIRYTVPDVDLSTIGSIEMHIVQCGKDIIKTREDLTIDAEAKTISYELTQEESLALVTKRPVEISVILMMDGERKELRPIIRADVEATRKNEVMV